MAAGMASRATATAWAVEAPQGTAAEVGDDTVGGVIDSVCKHATEGVVAGRGGGRVEADTVEGRGKRGAGAAKRGGRGQKGRWEGRGVAYSGAREGQRGGGGVEQHSYTVVKPSKLTHFSKHCLPA